MNIDRIRNMSDDKLERYLRSLSKGNNVCFKCGSEKGNYTINIQNKKKIQQKKLCCLCENCYASVLDYLGANDILWD